MLGVWVALSEAELHWRAFIADLIKRGLTGVILIVADDHAGLRAAQRAVLPSVPWQRCQFHLKLNARAHVTKPDQREAIARTEAQRLLTEVVGQWRLDAPKLADWAEANLHDGFSVFEYPQAHRVRLRTTNGLERINRESKGRTRVASMVPNAASCLRLVSALLTEFNEEWMSGKNLPDPERV